MIYSDIYPEKSKILSLLKQGYAVPVYKQIPCLGSAFDVFLKLKNKPHAFLLESVRPHKKIGEYSFIGCDPYTVFKVKLPIDPGSMGVLKSLQKLLFSQEIYHDDFLPAFTGGAVGYIGYDAAGLMDDINLRSYDDLNAPDIYFAFFDTVIVYDHTRKSMGIISIAKPGHGLKKALGKISKYESLIKSSKRIISISAKQKFYNKKPKVESSVSKKQFIKMVKTAKDYIRAGDIYQANLSQRLCVPSKNMDLFSLYENVRRINPSPFAGFLNFDDVKVVSCSPERLIQLRNNIVQTRPIAGTVARGKDLKQDKVFSRRLILSPKQRAEHIMLVDLQRNDIGRVCKYASVHVDEMMVLESYSHVIHIVSNVMGELKKGKDTIDLIKAVFPGGTITGVPKIRCMRIIDELEPFSRNLYTGAMGYIGFNGFMDLNIIIRTFVVKDNNAYVQVGAGIVADSRPEREYKETLDKAQALLEAVRG